MGAERGVLLLVEMLLHLKSMWKQMNTVIVTASVTA